jgi:hypothetical protein
VQAAACTTNGLRTVIFITCCAQSITSKTNNIKNNKIFANRVAKIPFNDSSQVYAFPYDTSKVVVNNNRLIDFDGKIFAGRMDIYGKDFNFNYDSFNIKSSSIERMKINIPKKVDPTTGESLKDTIEGSTNGIGSLSLPDSPDSPSGIMPGDVEYALTMFTTVAGSFILLCYFLYIFYLIFHKENSLHDATYHILIFIVLLVCLILFGIYFVDK